MEPSNFKDRFYSILSRLNRTNIHVFLIIVVALFVYSNSFDVPFQWDGDKYIKQNPIVKDLYYFSHPSEAKGFDAYYFLKTRYLGYLTFALNYKIGGLDVTGYHVFNVLVHILNALLIYYFVKLTFMTPFLKRSSLAANSINIALFSSLIFVTHPLQTEAVTYIFQRLASLSAFFCLITHVVYIRARLSGKHWLYAISVITASMAMLTKENAFTLPLIIALYEFLFFNGNIRKRALYLTPLFLTMIIEPVLHLNYELGLATAMEWAMRLESDVPRTDYFLTELRVFVTYIRLLFLPINQNLDYDYPVYHSFFELPVLMSFIFLVTIFGFAVHLILRSRQRPSLRLMAFGIFWFFAALSVESSVIPLPMLIDEYRVYRPSMGAIISFATFAFLLLTRIKGETLRKLVTAFMIMIPIVFAYEAHARNKVWKTQVSLWEDVVKKSPNKSRPHNNLGLAYSSVGQYDKAIQEYWTVLELRPDSADAHNNLGLAYSYSGMYDEAIKQYIEALEHQPNFAQAHNNLGLAYEYKGQVEKAIEQYRLALKIRPNFVMVHNNLGLAYASKGLFENAEKHFKAAIRLNPDFPDAHRNLGLIYLQEAKMNEAREEFKISLSMNPDDVRARRFLQYTYGLNKPATHSRR
jgi:tetratricopeptide (TPR) repeat protein